MHRSGADGGTGVCLSDTRKDVGAMEGRPCAAAARSRSAAV